MLKRNKYKNFRDVLALAIMILILLFYAYYEANYGYRRTTPKRTIPDSYTYPIHLLPLP